MESESFLRCLIQAWGNKPIACENEWDSYRTISMSPELMQITIQPEQSGLLRSRPGSVQPDVIDEHNPGASAWSRPFKADAQLGHIVQTQT
jgi:hypothetical protein